MHETTQCVCVLLLFCVCVFFYLLLTEYQNNQRALKSQLPGDTVGHRTHSVLTSGPFQLNQVHLFASLATMSTNGICMLFFSKLVALANLYTLLVNTERWHFSIYPSGQSIKREMPSVTTLLSVVSLI